MTELDRDALALLRAARGGDGPTSQERSAVLEAFAQRREESSDLEAVGLGRSSLRAVRPRSHRPRRALGWSLAALVLTGSLGAVASWSGVLPQWSFGTEPEEPTPQVNDPAVLPQSPKRVRHERKDRHDEVRLEAEAQPEGDLPEEAALPEEALPEEMRLEEVPAEASREVVRDAPRGTAPLSTTRGNISLGPELQLIVQARDALGRTDYTEALRWTRRHQAAFPSGELVQERFAIEALVACRSRGELSLALDFTKRWPGSLFSPRVARDCGLSSNSVPE